MPKNKIKNFILRTKAKTFADFYLKNISILIIMSNQDLIKENEVLKKENEQLKKLLDSYNSSRKNYYEKNKEIVNKKANERLKKLAEENPDKLKEYRRNAYLKRKEKLQSENIE